MAGGPLTQQSPSSLLLALGQVKRLPAHWPELMSAPSHFQHRFSYTAPPPERKLAKELSPTLNHPVCGGLRMASFPF